jgi:signal transduction histidine kinase
MEFFALDDQVAQLECDLSLAKDNADSADSADSIRLNAMVALAWQLRQRDPKRAISLVDEALAGLSDDIPEQQALILRLILIQSEIKFLSGEVEEGEQLTQTALQGFIGLGDAAGCADAYWLLTMAALAQFDKARQRQALEAMAAATADNDAVRYTVAQAAQAILDLSLGDVAARQHWEAYFSGQKTAHHPAAACWVEEFLGRAALADGEHAQAFRHLSRAYTLGLASGQFGSAGYFANAIGQALSNLNEHQRALEWMQRVLNLARQTGGDREIASASIYIAITMHRLQRHDDAWDLLQEALNLLAPMGISRWYALGLRYLGEVELARRQCAPALAAFELLEKCALQLKAEYLLAQARRGQAQALFQLDRPEPALRVAKALLQATHTPVRIQIDALCLLAAIEAHSPTPPMPGMSAPGTALHYLHDALTLATRDPNYIVPATLYGDIAREYARAGQHQKAYEYALQASAVRARTVSREVHGRAITNQMDYQTEQTRIEAEHHRQLAASEAQRASVLQQTKETLEHLSAIGQEITAHLDATRVLEVLERHAHHLLKADILALYLMDAEGQVLQRTFYSDDYGFSMLHIELDDPILNIARCVRERREIFLDLDPGQAHLNWIAPVPPTLSRLFGPLCVADKILGAITIQSWQRHVYGPREQLIFRTLAAYAAIALANAQVHGALTSAHEHLQKNHQQMTQQSKMAGLGTLTVGVANEINNPVNFAHVAAQNLAVDVLDFEKFLQGLLQDEEASEISAIFARHFSGLNAHIATMLNGTSRIKGIVQDLRAFSRAGEAEKKVVRLSQCLHSTLNLVRSSWLEKVEFIEVFDDDPEFECWPALLNQVFMNLLVNGCQAIEEKRQKNPGQECGKLCLSLKCVRPEGTPHQIEIAFQDSGVGISAEAQTRVMEPFYTTKAVGSGTGLGLSIAYEIVQKHGGHLRLNSTLGVGSCFTITLPLPGWSSNSTNSASSASSPL